MGRNISNYIKDIECQSGITDIMTVEHRSNNSKRDYLFCNKVQGKHIPVRPSQAFDLFDELTYKINDTLKGERILVVGFAETATAIGAYVASHLDGCVYHLQTTRENCEPVDKLLEFSEEHSHATEQYLYGSMETLPSFNYVLFVEDEISTGKTIINFIEEFKKINGNLHFGVASICNWQSDENKEKYADRHIDTFALIRGKLCDEHAKMDVNTKDTGTEYAGENAEVCKTNCKEVHMGFSTPFLIERTGRLPENLEYESILEETLEIAREFIGSTKRVLVLGTEEFMYYPMLVGEMLEGFGKEVYTHSTSRSSIDIIEGSNDFENELVNKSKLHSAYDYNRETYVYNLRNYDKVLIITDANMNDNFKQDIVSTLCKHGTLMSDILFINILK